MFPKVSIFFHLNSFMNKKHILAAQNTKVAFKSNYESTAGSRNDSHFNFCFHILKLKADD